MKEGPLQRLSISGRTCISLGRAGGKAPVAGAIKEEVFAQLIAARRWRQPQVDVADDELLAFLLDGGKHH